MNATLLPGLIGGVMWNIGNICSIYAADSPLGLAVGFPLAQCALMVAGLWGIFYFREMRGARPIALFFISGGVLICGAALMAVYG